VPCLNKLALEYQDYASFHMVYITEAHAKDEWPVGENISFCTQPKTLSERFDLAERLQSTNGLQVPVMVDSMSNLFAERFSAWPIRFFAVQDGKLAWKAQPTDEGYSVLALERWLASQHAQ